MTPNPLVQRFERALELSPRDRDRLLALQRPAYMVEEQVTLVDQGEAFSDCGVLVDGWAIRSRSLPDGRRQVLDVMPPGSFFSLDSISLRRSRESITTLIESRVAWFTPETLESVFHEHPRVGSGLLWSEAVERSILAEHLMSLGRRNATERTAHVLLELGRRLYARGLSDGSMFLLPVTQEILADLLGLSVIHVSRVLSNLEEMGCITRQGRPMCLKLHPDLKKLASFDEAYLGEEDALTWPS